MQDWKRNGSIQTLEQRRDIWFATVDRFVCPVLPWASCSRTFSQQKLNLESYANHSYLVVRMPKRRASLSSSTDAWAGNLLTMPWMPWLAECMQVIHTNFPCNTHFPNWRNWKPITVRSLKVRFWVR